MSSWDDADFNSPDPFVRFNAHQAAKGRAGIGDPDLVRKAARESPPSGADLAESADPWANPPEDDETHQ